LKPGTKLYKKLYTKRFAGQLKRLLIALCAKQCTKQRTKQSFPGWLDVRVFYLVISILLAVWLGGCSPANKVEKKPLTGKFKIAVSLADGEDDTSKIIKKIVEKRKKEDRITVKWLDAKNDPVKQRRDLEQLVESKVDVAVVQPVDPKDAARLVQGLRQNNVKVISLEKLPFNAPVDGHIMPDFGLAGRMQGQYVAAVLQGGGGQNQGGKQQGGGQQKVVILRKEDTDPAAEEITAANLSVLQQVPGVKPEILTIPRGDAVLAESLVRRLLASGSIPSFILANDDKMAMSAVKVLQQNGLAGRVVTVGLGGGKQLAAAMARGEHDAEVDIMPEVLANHLYDAALELAKGNHWQYDQMVSNGDYQVPVRLTPVRLLRPDNVFLLAERWGKNTVSGQQGGGGGGGGSSSGSGGGAGGGSGSGGSGSGSSGGSGSGGSSAGGGSAGGMTTILKITTRQGKTVEIQIDGEIARIETRRADASQAAGEGAPGRAAGGAGGGGGGGM